MRRPKTVPAQRPTSPLYRVTRRLPSFSGTQVSAVLDERAYHAFRALAAHYIDGTAVLREVIDREVTRDPVTSAVTLPTYSSRVWALAFRARTTRSAVVREGLLRLYRDTFGCEPTGRVMTRRTQQFEAVRKVYQGTHRASRRQGKSLEEAQREAESASRKAHRKNRSTRGHCPGKAS